LLNFQPDNYTPAHLLERRRMRFLNSFRGKEEEGFL
jgi:hypothetical protein